MNYDQSIESDGSAVRQSEAEVNTEANDNAQSVDARIARRHAWRLKKLEGVAPTREYTADPIFATSFDVPTASSPFLTVMLHKLLIRKYGVGLITDNLMEEYAWLIANRTCYRQIPFVDTEVYLVLGERGTAEKMYDIALWSHPGMLGVPHAQAPAHLMYPVPGFAFRMQPNRKIVDVWNLFGHPLCFPLTEHVKKLDVHFMCSGVFCPLGYHVVPRYCYTDERTMVSGRHKAVAPVIPVVCIDPSWEYAVDPASTLRVIVKIFAVELGDLMPETITVDTKLARRVGAVVLELYAVRRIYTSKGVDSISMMSAIAGFALVLSDFVPGEYRNMFSMENILSALRQPYAVSSSGGFGAVLALAVSALSYGQFGWSPSHDRVLSRLARLTMDFDKLSQLVEGLFDMLKWAGEQMLQFLGMEMPSIFREPPPSKAQQFYREVMMITTMFGNGLNLSVRTGENKPTVTQYGMAIDKAVSAKEILMREPKLLSSEEMRLIGSAVPILDEHAQNHQNISNGQSRLPIMVSIIGSPGTGKTSRVFKVLTKTMNAYLGIPLTGKEFKSSYVVWSTNPFQERVAQQPTLLFDDPFLLANHADESVKQCIAALTSLGGGLGADINRAHIGGKGHVMFPHQVIVTGNRSVHDTPALKTPAAFLRRIVLEFGSSIENGIMKIAPLEARYKGSTWYHAPIINKNTGQPYVLTLEELGPWYYAYIKRYFDVVQQVSTLDDFLDGNCEHGFLKLSNECPDCGINLNADLSFGMPFIDKRLVHLEGRQEQEEERPSDQHEEYQAVSGFRTAAIVAASAGLTLSANEMLYQAHRPQLRIRRLTDTVTLYISDFLSGLVGSMCFFVLGCWWVAPWVGASYLLHAYSLQYFGVNTVRSRAVEQYMYALPSLLIASVYPSTVPLSVVYSLAIRPLLAGVIYRHGLYIFIGMHQFFQLHVQQDVDGSGPFWTRIYSLFAVTRSLGSWAMFPITIAGVRKPRILWVVGVLGTIAALDKLISAVLKFLESRDYRATGGTFSTPTPEHPWGVEKAGLSKQSTGKTETETAVTVQKQNLFSLQLKFDDDAGQEKRVNVGVGFVSGTDLHTCLHNLGQCHLEDRTYVFDRPGLLTCESFDTYEMEYEKVPVRRPRKVFQIRINRLSADTEMFLKGPDWVVLRNLEIERCPSLDKLGLFENDAKRDYEGAILTAITVEEGAVAVKWSRGKTLQYFDAGKQGGNVGGPYEARFFPMQHVAPGGSGSPVLITLGGKTFLYGMVVASNAITNELGCVQHVGRLSPTAGYSYATTVEERLVEFGYQVREAHKNSRFVVAPVPELRAAPLCSVRASGDSVYKVPATSEPKNRHCSRREGVLSLSIPTFLGPLRYEEYGPTDVELDKSVEPWVSPYTNSLLQTKSVCALGGEAGRLKVVREVVKLLMKSIVVCQERILPLDDFETVNGYWNGRRKVPGVKMSSNTGMPYCLPEKKAMFIQQKDGTYVMGPLLEADFKFALVQLKKGEPIALPYIVAFKREVGKITQGEDGIPRKKKARVFAMVSLLLLLACRKYFCPIMDFIVSHPDLYGCAISVSAFSKEWEDIYHRLVRPGCVILEGDYMKYDKTMTGAQMEEGGEVLIDIAVHLGYSDEDIVVCRAILADIVYHVEMYRGDLYQFGGNSPSGHPLTAHLNSVVNLLISLSALSIARKQPVQEVITYSRFAILGDDLLVSTLPMDGLGEKFSEAMFEQHGQRVTSPVDKKLPIQQVSPHDMTFLKRKFVKMDPKYGGRIVGQLAVESMRKTLLWRVDRAPSTETEVGAMNSLLIESLFHGQEAYDRMRRFCREYLRELPRFVPGFPRVDEKMFLIQGDYQVLLEYYFNFGEHPAYEDDDEEGLEVASVF